MSEQEQEETTAGQSSVSKAFHPDRECDCERLGLDESAECIHDDPCWLSEAAYLRTNGVTLRLPLLEARALYDHTGTMPWAPGMWTHTVRAALSEALALHTADAQASAPDSASNASPQSLA